MMVTAHHTIILEETFTYRISSFNYHYNTMQEIVSPNCKNNVIPHRMRWSVLGQMGPKCLIYKFQDNCVALSKPHLRA